MTDHLRFRAWDKQLNVMLCEFTFNDLSGGEGNVYIPNHCCDVLIDDDDLVFMQSTGWHDVNDNLIFDKDILQCPDGWIGLVRWDEDALQWWCNDHRLTDLNKPLIIGNRFSNPELLEQVK